MPSRSTLRYATSIAFAAWLIAASPLSAQELTLPGDPLAGAQAESVDPPATATATDTPSSTQSSDGAVYSSNGTMLGPTGQGIDIGPTSAYAAGSVYNPTLGAHLRARYSSQSYGQQEGQLDLGTMRFMDLDGGIAFVDGQVTLNEESGVGYNVGVGYRWMTLPLLPFSPDDEKIMGVSIWSDGQTIGQENFFSQVGVSLEFLGEHIDFRANGYAPVSSRTQLRDGVSTGTFTFAGNGVSEQLRFVRDTALTVGEAELAGRLGNMDAWAFAGVYGFNGGQYDGVGGELGLRGYATPDLLLSISVANDDEFDTNAIFSATWFIGRTRAENCPTGTLADRFREPVLRNTYIATQQDSYLAAGGALIDANGGDIRIVHVDSTAAAGGDGSFENPLASLDDINANSLDDDIVYAHGGSDFNSQTAMLRDGQTFVGEGLDNVFQITTNQFGTIDLPETASGAQSGPVATIDGGAGGQGVVLADNNTVQNLEFDGGDNAIVTGAAGVGSFNPNLNNLTISNTNGDAIALMTEIRTDTDDFDGDGDTSETLDALGTVTIDEIAFNNVGGHDIVIDGNATDATDESGQTINISNITSTGNITEESISLTNTSSVGISSASISDFNYDGGGTGQGAVELLNTAGPAVLSRIDIAGSSAVGVTAMQSTGNITINDLTYDGGATGVGAVMLDQTEGQVTMNTLAATGGTGVAVTATQSTGDITIDGLTYDGETTAAGALLFDQADGNINVSNTTITGGSGAAPAVEARQTMAAISLDSTVSIDNVNGEAVFLDRLQEDGSSSFAFNGDITNDSIDGGGVRVVDNDAVVNFGGAITTQNTNSVTITDSKANITFSGAIDDNGTGDAITITNAGIGTGNTAEVLFSPGATINNDEGRVLVVDNGDDNIAFNDTVTDTGDGILITDRQSGADITFEQDAALSLTQQTAAITMTGNNDASSVNINGDLTINSTGTGITSNGGELNIANPNGSNELTSTDTAINLTGGSGSVNFEEVTSTGGTVAVNLNNFDGTVDINGGQLGSTAGNTAVTVTDSSLDLDGVDITSGSGTAVQAIFNGTTNARTLRVANGNLNSDNVIVTTSGDQDATVTLQDVTNIGDTDLNVGGSGAVNATMTDVSGFGDITLDASLSGDADLSLTRVNTAGILAANSTAGSDSNLTLDVEDSGNTSAFTSVVFNDQGAGRGTMTFNNSETTSGVNFDSIGGGNGSLTVIGSTLGGGINFDTAGTGSSVLTVTNATVGGDIDYNSGNNGASNLIVTGGSVAGSILGDATGTGNFISRLNGTSLTGGRVALNADNTGDALFNISGFNFDTGADDTAIDVAFATTIADADLTVINNTGVTTGNGRALNVDINGADVDFQIANNLFTNNSPLATDARAVFVDVSGSSTTNATITDNVFTNSDATGTVQFEIATTAGAPNLNLNFSGNTANSGGGTGNGEMIIRESAGTVSVFELNDTFTSPTRNTGTVTFDPNNEPDFDDLPAAPALPSP